MTENGWGPGEPATTAATIKMQLGGTPQSAVVVVGWNPSSWADP